VDYRQRAAVIVKELDNVFKCIDLSEIERLVTEIMQAKKIILIGVGREGLSTKAFTMRLMHLGIQSHWIWDETTPAMGEGDLLIATSGCGEIGHIDYVVEAAKKYKARVAVVTGDPFKKTPKRADVVLFLPATVYLGTAQVVPSVQPMGNLFEQSLLILFDMMIMDLQERLAMTKEKMAQRHRNLE
jgi:Predicted sugar phosphate isomerase involved in capsule formation